MVVKTVSSKAGIVCRAKGHNAVDETSYRSVLWNPVENVEKRKDAQVAGKFRISLPNEWSYELATTVMQDYVRRNFTLQGMWRKDEAFFDR